MRVSTLVAALMWGWWHQYQAHPLSSRRSPGPAAHPWLWCRPAISKARRLCSFTGIPKATSRGKSS